MPLHRSKSNGCPEFSERRRIWALKRTEVRAPLRNGARHLCASLLKVQWPPRILEALEDLGVEAA
jgi:hypothetical protein